MLAASESRAGGTRRGRCRRRCRGCAGRRGGGAGRRRGGRARRAAAAGQRHQPYEHRHGREDGQWATGLRSSLRLGKHGAVPPRSGWSAQRTPRSVDPSRDAVLGSSLRGPPARRCSGSSSARRNPRATRPAAALPRPRRNGHRRCRQRRRAAPRAPSPDRCARDRARRPATACRARPQRASAPRRSARRCTRSRRCSPTGRSWRAPSRSP